MNSTKFYYILIIVLSIQYTILGQETSKISKSNIYVEVSSILLFNQASINYEHILNTSDIIKLYGRIGVGKVTTLFFHKENVNSQTDYLLGTTLLTGGKSDHHFEADLGAYLGLYKNGEMYPIIDVGYRYQRHNEGLNFKIKIGTLGLGLGMGYNF